MIGRRTWRGCSARSVVNYANPESGMTHAVLCGRHAGELTLAAGNEPNAAMMAAWHQAAAGRAYRCVERTLPAPEVVRRLLDWLGVSRRAARAWSEPLHRG